MTTGTTVVNGGPLPGYLFFGLGYGFLALVAYNTYASLYMYSQGSQEAKDTALRRVATGVGVGMAAPGIGEGIGAASDGSSGGRRRTGRKRKGKKTYRKTK